MSGSLLCPGEFRNITVLPASWFVCFQHGSACIRGGQLPGKTPSDYQGTYHPTVGRVAWPGTQREWCLAGRTIIGGQGTYFNQSTKRSAYKYFLSAEHSADRRERSRVCQLWLRIPRESGVLLQNNSREANVLRINCQMRYSSSNYYLNNSQLLRLGSKMRV